VSALHNMQEIPALIEELLDEYQMVEEDVGE